MDIENGEMEYCASLQHHCISWALESGLFYTCSVLMNV